MLRDMVIVIAGPIASGKSTIARAVARELERRGVRVAVIDLDVVHDELTAGEPNAGDATWPLARRAAASLASALLEAGVVVVVAEGSFNTASARDEFAQGLDASEHPLYVTLLVSFDEALRRARRDPTRGRSRDPAFLRPYFAAVEPALATVPEADVVIDTERVPARTAALTIAGLVSRDASDGSRGRR
jgi:shikimate kinase